ncbi:hypothetical protein [Flavobacterium beibuense]|uniref:hypothetical protein n=1 Tax=Flavobacterium beibuense TaxID=657326 RepID=UPI003A921E1E
MKAFYSLLLITLSVCFVCCNKKEKVVAEPLPVKYEADSKYDSPIDLTSNENNYDSIAKHKRDSIKLEAFYEWEKNIGTISFPDTDSTFIKYEQKTDSTFINNFLKQTPELFEISEKTKEELIKNLHIFDLNGDQENDVIYQGFSGGEATITYIYINKKNIFKRVFSEFQYMQNLSFNNNKLVSFKMYSPGCCSDPLIVIYDYKVIYDTNNNMTFKIDKALGYEDYMEAPVNYFEKARFFNITKEDTHIRYSTYIIDDTENPYFDGYGDNGNNVGNVKTAETGKAIAYKTNDSQTWIFASFPCYCEFYDYHSNNQNEFYPKETYGWILKSDTDLK